MTDSFGLQSPEALSEKYVISREKPSIVFGVGNNVTVQLSSPSDVDNGRERDSSNVQSKNIMNHKGEIRQLRGRILTSNGPLVGFRSLQESFGESMKLMNLQTKQRFLFKDLPHRTVDLSFATHHRFIAVLIADSSLYIYEVSDNCEAKEYLIINNWPTFSKHGSMEQPQLSWCPYVQGDDDEEDIHMVAVFLGRQIYIVNIGTLKELGTTVDFNDAIKEEGGLFSHYFSENMENEDLRITAVCISPDSTAIAIAKTEGPIQFFTFNEDNNTLKDAQTFEPRGFARGNGVINDLIFLDDLTPDRKALQFWRSCVVVSNDGRKLALYDCQGFRCLGRIRFESTLAVNKFICISDPGASYLHLLDVDGMNIYSVELSNPPNEAPRFVGVTQTSFCHPIFALCPITVNTFENADDSGDDLFNNSDSEESSDEEEDKLKHFKTKKHFIAMGKSSMVELQMTLKKHIPTPASTISKEPSPSVYVDTEQPETSPASQGLLMQVAPPTASGIDCDIINQKLNDVLTRLSMMEESSKERDALLAQKVVADLAQQAADRDVYMLKRLEDIAETNRVETINALRGGFLNLSSQLENVIRANGLETAEYVSQRVGSTCKLALTDCIIPTFERQCEVLFERLNEHFRHGVSEYLAATTQMIQGSAVATMQVAMQQQQQQQHQKSEMERLTILQLIETSPEKAVELALNKADPNLLEYVCSKIDPEKILVPGNTSLRQDCLLSLVQQFTATLHRDRDLKVRWIELVIPEIDMSDPEIAILVAPVAQKLLMALQELIDGTTDEKTRRYLRLLYQMARSSLLQASTPSQRSSASVLSKFLSQSEPSQQ